MSLTMDGRLGSVANVNIATIDRTYASSVVCAAAISDSEASASNFAMSFLALTSFSLILRKSY